MSFDWARLDCHRCYGTGKTSSALLCENCALIALAARDVKLAALEELMNRRVKEAERISEDFTESPSYARALEDVTDEMRDILIEKKL